MAEKWIASIGGCAMRILRLDLDTGAIEGGSDGGVVTHGFQVFTVGAEVAEGATIEEKDACGRLAANYKEDDQIRFYTGALTLVKKMPAVEEMLSGGRRLDGGGGAIGGSAPALGTPNLVKVSIEIWTKHMNAETGTQDPDFPYLRWVFPRVESIVPTGFEISSGALKPTYSMKLVENPNWNDGPEDDPWPAGAGEADRAYQWLPVTDIPDEVVGYVSATAS